MYPFMNGYMINRGAKQIRTAVDGFADRYLATRSWHRFYFRVQK